jgi:predicted metal-dependent hydrolase
MYLTKDKIQKTGDSKREIAMDIPNVSSTYIIKKKRSKHLKLYLEKDSRLRVSIPYWLSFVKAIGILNKNVTWVNKSVARMKKDIIKQSEAISHLPKMSYDDAKNKLIRSVEVISRKYGFKYNKVSVKRMRSRWGSCSSLNNISLNVMLAVLPQELMEYVIIHELAHTQIKDHSIYFWARMDELLSDPRSLDRQMKKYRLDAI